MSWTYTGNENLVPDDDYGEDYEDLKEAAEADKYDELRDDNMED